MADAVVPSAVDPRPLKVLIHRTGSLGDTLVALPSLRLIAAAFPAAQRVLLCNAPKSAVAAPAMAVLDGLGLVQRAVTYQSTGGRATALAVFRAVRAERPDVVVSLSAKHGAGTALRDWLLFKLAGVPRVIGLGRSGRALRMIAPDRYETEAQRLARTISALGSIDWNNAAAWSIATTAPAAIPQQPYFCIAVGTKQPANDWGQDRWLELVQQLAASAPELRLVCVGSAEDHARSAELLARWPPGGDNLCGALSIAQTAAVLSHARLLICHDSGPMHLAAAAGTRCVAVYSRRNRMGQWFPLGTAHVQVYAEVPCAGCGLTVCAVQGNRCTRLISAGEVAAQVQRAWSGPAAEPRV
ncbi:MAG TPA: glycosyltransferase family 9 protein [Nevskiaceae bacterium]|nr:glycosyltransferase family 9 protein [Nevskiaceae bacterium]